MMRPHTFMVDFISGVNHELELEPNHSAKLAS